MAAVVNLRGAPGEAGAIQPVKVRRRQGVASTCKRVLREPAGDDGHEAYTAFMWGMGMSHESLQVAGAEVVSHAEGNTLGTAMRGVTVLPGSEAISRMKGSRRNLGYLGSGRAAARCPARIGKARSRSR